MNHENENNSFFIGFVHDRMINSCDLDSKVYSSFSETNISENPEGGCALYVDWVVCLF